MSFLDNRWLIMESIFINLKNTEENKELVTEAENIISDLKTE